MNQQDEYQSEEFLDLSIGEILVKVVGGLAVPVAGIVGIGATLAVAQALGGNAHEVVNHVKGSLPLEMGYTLQTLAYAGAILGASCAYMGAAIAVTDQDVRDFGNKIKSFGAGIVECGTKAGQALGLVKEGKTATLTLIEPELKNQDAPFMARAMENIKGFSGLMLTTSGLIGLCVSTLNQYDLVTTPGFSSLVIGAATTAAVGGALLLLRSDLPANQSEENISKYLKTTEVELKRDDGYKPS